MLRFSKIVWFILAFWAVVCLTLIAVMISSLLPESSLTDKSQLGLVTIEGELSDARPVIEQLHTLRDETSIKGIVLRVESPGGSVAAAQEIFSALEEMRRDSFPVVATFGNMAASGGYYSALPAERIFANPGTLTGSIGVITQFMHGEKLMEKIGLGSVTVTSGNMKDVGNPFRAPRPEDLAYLKSVVDDTHEQFLEAVSKWRKIPIDSLRPIADGRVFTGRMAKAAGLVDTLGTMQDAIRWLSTRCGLESVPTTLESVKPEEPWIRQLFDGLESAVPAGLRNSSRVLWKLP